MSKINEFLLQNELRIAQNPCVSPDFCLDWPSLRETLRRSGAVQRHPLSEIQTALGSFTLAEDPGGDPAWLFRGDGAPAQSALSEGCALPSGELAFPATWHNLLKLKNLLQEHDPQSTVFPSAS